MATTVKAEPKKILTKKVGNITMVKPAPKPKKKKKGILKKVAQRFAGVTILLPLQPFKPAMKKNLEGKGISTKGMTFPVIIEKFFNENISKKANKASSYEELEHGTIANNYLMQLPIEKYNDSDSLASDALVIIVQETIKFFKKVKDKKKQIKAEGENPKNLMTKEENDLADEAEKVTKELEEKAKDSETVSKGSLQNVIKYGLIIVVIGLVVWYFMRKK